jgi:hypothetical protein
MLTNFVILGIMTVMISGCSIGGQYGRSDSLAPDLGKGCVAYCVDGQTAINCVTCEINGVVTRVCC